MMMMMMMMRLRMHAMPQSCLSERGGSVQRRRERPAGSTHQPLRLRCSPAAASAGAAHDKPQPIIKSTATKSTAMKDGTQLDTQYVRP